MKDLSVLIPSRNEMFLSRTIEDVLANREADTEVIAVLDGVWASPVINQHERVNIIYVPEAIGQRAATNLACKLSKAKFVCKIDAHCAFDKGFDRKMIEGFEKVGENVTMAPVMNNLHAFDWNCRDCNWKKYQGPTPPKCERCGSTNLRKKMIWQSRHGVHSSSFCFDSTPHFQYGEPYKHTQEYKMGTIIGYKLLIDFSLLSPDALKQGVALPFDGISPPFMAGIINLLADFARSHQFTILPDSSRLWQNMTANTVNFSPVDNGWGVGVQEINFIRDKTEMERIATLPVLTDVVNYGYILTTSAGDGTNQPSIGETVCQGFLSEFSTVTVTPLVNSSLENPTTRRTLNSNTLNKFNRILGGEFVYSEIRKCFHNGSVALIPVYDKTITESMSLQGSCFFSTREKYWELKLCGEDLGSWGNQGIELACATWLTGGRVLVNHNTWYAHMFRTQGGDFSFPYQQSGRQVAKTKQKVKDLFWNKKHPKQIHPVSWLVSKFWPVIGWDQAQLDQLKASEGLLKT